MLRTLRARLPNGTIVAIVQPTGVAGTEDNLPAEAERLASMLESPATRELDLLSFLANVAPTVFPESDPARRPRTVHGSREYGVDLTFPLAAAEEIGLVAIKTHRSNGMRGLLASARQLENVATRSPFEERIAVAYLIAGRGDVADDFRNMATRLPLPFPVALLSWDDIFLRVAGKVGSAQPEGRPDFTVVLLEVVHMSRQLLRALVLEPALLAGIDDRAFEGLVATLLHDMGLQDVELTPPRQDGGRDVVAVHQDRTSGERQVFLIECKHWVSGEKVTMRWALSLLDVKRRDEATAAILLSSSGFGPRLLEQEATLNRAGLFLKNQNHLHSWIQVWERQYGGILLQPVHPGEALGLRCADDGV